MFSPSACGDPVFRAATVDGRRWWARVRQFRSSAYVEVWNDAGFDAETVVPTDDVVRQMTRALRGGGDLPAASADVLFHAAMTFTAAAGEPPAVDALRRTAADLASSRPLLSAARSA